jgi:hypothetical protein
LYAAFATEQRPDILIYDKEELKVHTGWGHPSPLQTYFYQNGISYPFRSLSTANYRGHIAHWELRDSKLFLSHIVIGDSTYLPQKFGIHSRNDSLEHGQVFADWFSGVLFCFLVGEDYNDYYKATYYFLIRHGELVSSERIVGYDTACNSELALMNSNYIAFYYRLDDELITVNGTKARLNSNEAYPSPVFNYYGPDLLSWPYYWENLEHSGAPCGDWSIEGDRLFLKRLTLHFGTNFEYIDTLELDLKEEFPGMMGDSGVFAKWVNGVYCIKFGKMTHEKGSFDFPIFEVNKYCLLRIRNGIVIEEYDIGPSMNLESVERKGDPKFTSLYKEFLHLP